MSKRKHIPKDRLPPRPESSTRMILPIRHETFTEELLRTTRDHVDRALQEIIRVRTSLPELDKLINLYTDDEKNASQLHKITLAELNTLLAEFSAVMDQAYSQKKPSKKTGRKFKSFKRCGHRRIQGIQPMSREGLYPHQHPRQYPTFSELKPAAQLIRRTELIKVGEETE